MHSQPRDGQKNCQPLWQADLRPPFAGCGIEMQLKAGLLRDVLHQGVVRQDVRDETAKLFFPTDLDEQAKQPCAKTVALPLVADYDRSLRFVQPVQFAQPSDAENFVAISPWVLVIDDQRDLAVVIVKTNLCETLVGNARIEP